MLAWISEWLNPGNQKSCAKLNAMAAEIKQAQIKIHFLFSSSPLLIGGFHQKNEAGRFHWWKTGWATGGYHERKTGRGHWKVPLMGD